MQKIKYRNSLKFRSMAALIGLLVLFSSLIIAYNLYIFKIMDRQIDATLKNSLEMYTQEVERDLDNAEAFLVNKCLNRDVIRKIQSPTKSLERYLAILEVQDIFDTSFSHTILWMDFFYMICKMPSILERQNMRRRGNMSDKSKKIWII